ncbi:MAG: S-adenosyl-l-methionine hydroxide adenosyltransferase family protein [Gaiellaceae bacterium]
MITFLTDFGLQDDFVGTCHGVMARIAPEVRVIDLTHGIAPQAVLQGALVLRDTTTFMPVGVHLAVVDPGVGGNRRAVAVRTADGRTFVGPDNGLLMLAADEPGVEAAHELTDERYRLPEVSRTFHARDIFAPAAAHLASGVPIHDLGPPVDPSTLVRVEVPEPRAGRAQVAATVLGIDRFGNVATNLRHEHLELLRVGPGERVEIRLTFDAYYAIVAGTFADAGPGELILYEDSYGLVTLAISNGDAARLTGVGVGDELRVAAP